MNATPRRFLRGERGSAAIESALALTVLVVAFAGLMEIVQVSYNEDRMGRAARAAARALALNPATDACAAIRRELALAEDFDCGAAWTVTVDRGVSPESLPDTPDGTVTTGTGDMVLVRVAWNREPWSFDAGGDGEDDTDSGRDNAADPNSGDSGSSDTEGDAGAVPVVVMGLARCELALCGESTS